ncbi:hypothetical protein Aduo_004587 [Ancylostoma duodenale]
MSFLFRCLFLAISVILALIILNVDFSRSVDEEGDGKIVHLNRRGPWYNKTYDAEIEYRNYAIHPLADTILTSIRRQVESNGTYNIPEMWALPPFGPLRENIVIAPNYDLATCQIEKIMTTVRDAVFCYLSDPIGFEANNRTISSELWKKSYCGWSNYRSNIDDVEREMARKYMRFALIRNPFERFLSGYVDKCLNEKNFSPQVRCLGCRYNLRCFVSRLFHLLYGMHYNRTYLAREIWYVARHFAPQSWQCNFKKQLSTYDLIEYPESSDQVAIVAGEFDRVLKKAGVPQDMRAIIRKELIKGRSPHSTSKSRARIGVRKMISTDRYVRQVLALIYYFDYIVFGFRPTPSLFE